MHGAAVLSALFDVGSVTDIGTATDWNGVDVPEVLGRGFHATAYRLGAWVVRVPRSLARHRSIERQTRLYQFLAAAGFPLPRDAAVVHGRGGRLVAGLYRYIEGTPASATQHGSRLARDLGVFLATLHEFPTAGLRNCCDIVPNLWTDRFEPRWDLCRPHLPTREQAWIQTRIDAFLNGGGVSGASLALVHGDLNGNHLLVRDDGSLAGVIDIGGPRVTDPALDFGALLEHFGPRFTHAILAEYGGTLDSDLLRRAHFYADLRPISTMALGLTEGSGERVRWGRERLAARMANVELRTPDF